MRYTELRKTQSFCVITARKKFAFVAVIIRVGFVPSLVLFLIP
jgi:hypothetical protein